MLRRVGYLARHVLKLNAENSIWRHKSFLRHSSAVAKVAICPGCGSVKTDDPSRPGHFAKHESKSAPVAFLEKRRREAEIYAATMATLDDDTQKLILPSLANEGIVKDVGEQKEPSLLCSRCHSLLHHSSIPGPIQEEKASSFDVYSTIRKDPDALVINVIDIMDFPLSFLNLRQHVGLQPRIIHVLSRTDVLYKKPFTQETIARMSPILKQLAQDEKLDIRAISALKGWDIAPLANTLRKRRHGTNIYFVGSANAGKSSLIATLGRRSNTPPTQLPIVSHLPGTTLASVPTRVALFGEALGGGPGSVIDLPGVLQSGFASLIKPEALRQSLPHKYINASPTGLRPGQSLLLGDLIEIQNVGEEHLLVTPYMQLASHKTRRPDHHLEQTSEVRRDDTPPFETALEKTFTIPPTLHGMENIFDLVFKDVGFVGIALWKGEGKVKVRTPGGQYAGLRSPALIRNSYRPERITLKRPEKREKLQQKEKADSRSNSEAKM